MMRTLSAFAVACTCGFGGASAAVVNFDSYWPLNWDGYFRTTSDGGLDFAVAGSGPAYIWDGSSPNSNGTPNLILGWTDTTITITKSGGGIFDLDSIDMAISWYGPYSTEVITVNGNDLMIDQTLKTYALNLAGVSSVTITSLPSGGYWLADNIVYDAAASVPEPGSIALLAAAGIALVGQRRYRART